MSYKRFILNCYSCGAEVERSARNFRGKGPICFDCRMAEKRSAANKNFLKKKNLSPKNFDKN